MAPTEQAGSDQPSRFCHFDTAAAFSAGQQGRKLHSGRGIQGLDGFSMNSIEAIRGRASPSIPQHSMLNYSYPLKRLEMLLGIFVPSTSYRARLITRLIVYCVWHCAP